MHFQCNSKRWSRLIFKKLLYLREIIKSMGQGKEKHSDQMTISGDGSIIAVHYYVNLIRSWCTINLKIFSSYDEQISSANLGIILYIFVSFITIPSLDGIVTAKARGCTAIKENFLKRSVFRQSAHTL